MTGRTQCEGEALHRAAAEKLGLISRGLEGAAAVALFINPHAAFVLEASSKVIGQIGNDANDKANRLDKGCDKERYEQGKKDAAAAAAGTASGGGGDPHGVVTDGGVKHCGQMYVGGSSSSFSSGGVYHGSATAGSWVGVCMPIALDLDGDGIEYRTMSSPIYTDTDGDGRTEVRAWVGADDGLLFYDVNADGIGQHMETVLTSFVEGAHTDLEALHAFDSNADGRIDANDASYQSLKVGRDFNQNGFFETNEVATLAQHGIARIDLVTGVQHLMDHDNPPENPSGIYEFHTGQFVRSNGSIGLFADVALEEKQYAALVFSDSYAGIVNLGSAHAWIQNSAAGIWIDLNTAWYAGYFNFVDFFGNVGNDYVIGTSGANTLFGGGGIDVLLGEGGDDTVVADFDDLAYGNVQGGAGNDALIYDGTVSVSIDAAARSFETVMGGSGNDTLYVSSSVAGPGVTLLGEAGNDWLQGGEGNDMLAGGTGVDVLLAGNGDDFVFADQEDNLANVQGGAGLDSLTVASDIAFSLNVHAHGFEIVSGGAGNDYLYTVNDWSAPAAVVLYGRGGDDTLHGGVGDDFLVGGPGSDSFYGGYGGDDIFVIDRYDNLANINSNWGSYEKGTAIIFDDTTPLYIANLHTMRVKGVTGGNGDDTVHASRTDNDYWREKADNFLEGGRGNDYLYGGAGKDVYTWNRGGGHDIFQDRDYGEWYGDVIHLGEHITTADVMIENIQGVQKIYVTGADGGSMRLMGFAGYGPADRLMVAGVTYDLATLLNAAGGQGSGGINLATYLQGGYGGGGGGSTGGGGGGWTGGGGSGEIPPIVLDLDGDGFELIAPKKSGIYFDWDGDGIKDETGWAGPDDGFLVLDRDDDGQITRADEISFGVVGGKKKDPFISDLEGLREFDTNGNSSLDRDDAAWDQFRVWRDKDSDAVVDDGEMVTLDELGLVALSLDGYQTGDKIKSNQNTIFATTDAVFENGESIKVADVLLGTDLAHAEKSTRNGGDAVMPMMLRDASEMMLIADIQFV